MAHTFKINHIAHSAHYRERTESIKYIIIHCSAPSPEKQLKILNELGLSAHYIIGQNGEITENLPPEKVAYHAGKSHWQKSTGESLNGTSIGIELESPNLGQTSKDFTERQIRKLCALLKHLSIKYHIKPANILGHSDIAPTRKPDPGAGFPWKRLAAHNLCPWYNLRNLSDETDELKLLQSIGYNTEVLAAARYAFCRHFFPEEIAVEQNLQKLLDNPYPADFIPQNQKKYFKRLRAAALAYK